MKALTVKQPWASLIITGIKDVENRTWPVPRQEPTGPMGPFPFWIAIHAGASFDRSVTAWVCGRCQEVSSLPGYELPVDGCGGSSSRRHEWFRASRGLLPIGVLGAVSVVSCHHADECRDPLGFCSPWAQADMWHWRFGTPIVGLTKPIPLLGRQGLWNLPEAADQAVSGAAAAAVVPPTPPDPRSSVSAASVQAGEPSRPDAPPPGTS